MAIVVAVAAVLVLALCGCVGLTVLSSFAEDPVGSGEPYHPGYVPDEDEGTSAPPRDPATTPSGGPGTLTVVYEVAGTGTADIQFYDANADFFQVDGVETPWRMALTANDRERVQLIVSPADLTRDDKVTCSITINGKVVSRDSGVYGATCFGW
ncbi:MmpS family transport accessory protein [Micromonospora sp. NPDC007271]|uniref:MmpS family transport accessory protein n=1 Tax=Micromonospora sp. NPDC007271 TaxID=3154587 RepID=UPI0033F8C781